MASVNDQFEHGRIPLKPLDYTNKDLSQCNEIMINYGEDGNYHIYITHHNNPKEYIDITEKILEEVIKGPEVNSNNFTININGLDNPGTLSDIINYIYSRFSHANNPSGFDYDKDKDKLEDATSVLLQTVDGTAQLPVTSADNVYDRDGNNIQVRLDNMNRLGFAVTYLKATTNNQSSFDFDYLFEDYSDLLEIRIGTTYIDKSRYTITKNYYTGSDNKTHYSSGTINFINESIEINRRIDLVWIFNSTYDSTEENPKGSKLFMSGSRIADSTIPASKLEMTSDSYYFQNSNSIATSKALANLYNDLTEAINIKNTQNIFYCADKNSRVDNTIMAYIGRDVEDNDTIIITMACDKISSTKLSVAPINNINNVKYYTIKTPDGNDIRRGFRNNQIVKFKLDGSNAIVLNYIGNINSNKYCHDCIDQEYEISFNLLNYSEGNIIHVYRNGIRLFEDIDYTINLNNSTITLFVRTEQGERIVFESLGI